MYDSAKFEFLKKRLQHRCLPVSFAKFLKAQSCKLHNKKYMIISTQIRSTEIFAFPAVLGYKLLSHKVLFIENNP